MKNTSGRPVDLSGINIPEILDYTKKSKQYRNYMICHSIITLYNGNSMQDVCKVLGITRETIRKWKGQLRNGGLKDLLKEKKVGKRARIGKDKLLELKKLIKQKPIKYGYEGKKWTGNILMDYLQKQWNIKVGIRTAQLWLKQVR
jgi:transposase